ncbi:Alanyl-tRNA editing protein AlaX-M [uncultured archaeon]|nr:Alanyl-tRNA editing protein AlaX-M [uncultured archaeon]
MQGALYLNDSYLKSCKSKVVAVKEGKFIVLDQTIFYPRGGGQPCDTGKLVRIGDGAEFPVASVAKAEGNILHEVAGEGLQQGDGVECIIDWPRRHRLMRMHTAGHILSAIMFRRQGILITGNQLDTGKTRFDFSMENFDKTVFQSLVDEANAAIARNLEVSVSFLPRDEAMKVEGAVKLAAALPPEIKELRMVRIGDVDYQADGGTHVKNTSEIGKIILVGTENKGKSNRRIYYTLEP